MILHAFSYEIGRVRKNIMYNDESKVKTLGLYFASSVCICLNSNIGKINSFVAIRNKWIWVEKPCRIEAKHDGSIRGKTENAEPTTKRRDSENEWKKWERKGMRSGEKFTGEKTDCAKEFLDHSCSSSSSSSDDDSEIIMMMSWKIAWNRIFTSAHFLGTFKQSNSIEWGK